jgi:hypothetical protein
VILLSLIWKPAVSEELIVRSRGPHGEHREQHILIGMRTIYSDEGRRNTRGHECRINSPKAPGRENGAEGFPCLGTTPGKSMTPAAVDEKGWRSPVATNGGQKIGGLKIIYNIFLFKHVALAWRLPTATENVKTSRPYPGVESYEHVELWIMSKFLLEL